MSKISQEEYEKRIKELQDELEELKKVKVVDNKPKKGEIWEPKKNETYYYIASAGIVHEDKNNGTCYDNQRLYDYLFYKTREEALYRYNADKFTEMFRRYVEEHSEPLDWEDFSKCKYYIYWSYHQNCFGYADDVSCKSQGIIYSSSKAILDDAIKFVGRDNVKKYVLGVIDD